MDPIRVAFDIAPLFGVRTGVGHAVDSMHGALARRSDVDLRDYLVSFRARPAPDVLRLPLPAFVAQRLWGLTDHPRADRFMADAQLVHGTNYTVPPSRLPRVVSVYDCWFLHHQSLAAPAVRRAGKVLKRAVSSGAVVHVSSQATARAVNDMFSEAHVEVIPLGALPLATPPKIAPIPELVGRPFILAVGTQERRKNLPRLVEAFGQIATDHPDVALVLAGGRGDDRTAIDEAIDGLGSAIATRVLITGWVDDDVRSWLLHAAAVMAYPSLDEGFGFPLLDAMQAATPIVASTAGSIPEVTGTAALLGAADDVDALASNLVIALTDRDVRRRLIHAGSAQWQRFAWDDCAVGLASLYRRLVNEARP